MISTEGTECRHFSGFPLNLQPPFKGSGAWLPLSPHFNPQHNSLNEQSRAFPTVYPVPSLFCKIGFKLL